jgi:hypothetical protein
MDQGKVMSKVTSFVKRFEWLWIAILLALALQVAVWFADRRSPFSFSTYTSTSATPGNIVRIVVQVERDLDRECSAVFSRHLIDPAGVRYDLVAGQYMSADALRKMDALMPGELRLALFVPESSPAGLAHLFTSLQYSCNPVHRTIWPIEMTMEIDFIVDAP